MGSVKYSENIQYIIKKYDNCQKVFTKGVRLLEIKKILSKDDKFTADDLAFIGNINNKSDYVLMNLLEQKMIEIQGKDFVKKSHPKIQYIMSLLLDNDIESLYDFYSGSFDEYMKICNNSYSQIGSFNITFAVLIHLATKIIRKCS